jgi:hypothetical protein
LSILGLIFDRTRDTCLKNENNEIENKTKSRNKMKLLNNLKFTDIRGKIIITKDVKIKIIQKILNKKSIPKCQDNFEFSSHMS